MHLVRLVEDLSLCSVEARLARLILQKAQGDALRRQPWATQAEMAARLGTVPDMVNRSLRKLAEAGVIRVERHQIQILDKEGLAGPGAGGGGSTPYGNQPRPTHVIVKSH